MFPENARLRALVCAPIVVVSVLVIAQPASADDISNPQRTTYGDVGLLEMPSARMAPDGQISGTIAMLRGTQRYNVAFQLTPWFEGSFRYSRIANIGSTSTLYDRSFGMKLRFIEESDFWPDVSLGVRDLLGTGVYASEYVVATKQFGSVEATAGLGWGRLASVDAFANPLASIFPSFRSRPAFTGVGGTVNFGQFFHGPSMGLFGGAIWHSPIENLDVIVEYSSDDYVQEQVGGKFKVRMPVNFGLSYTPLDQVRLTAGWLYGTSYGVALTFSADPTRDLAPQRFGPEIPAPVIRPPKRQVDALAALIAKPVPPDPRPLSALPFVQLPVTPEQRSATALSTALMSAMGGVRDVDVAGHTAMIQAHLQRHAAQACGRFTSVVATVAGDIDTVAVADLDDPDGEVAICPVENGFRTIADVRTIADASVPPATPEAPDTDPAIAEKKIRDDIAGQSIKLRGLSIGRSAIWVYFENPRYRNETEAVGRIARVLMADAPASVEIFHIVSAGSAVAMREFQITRSGLERATLAYGTAFELGDAIVTRPAALDNPVLEAADDDVYPKLHWKIGPGVHTGFFDPNVPIQVQLIGAADLSVEVTRNLTLETRLEGNIYNNYDLTVPSNSVLPHVRSDILKYLKYGENGIANLDAVYRARIAPDVAFEARAGYLEDMFAGAGAQVLWRPENSRFAIGADLYQLWQRDFNRLFGLQKYNILTGHVSVYYDSPWYGLNFAVHGGRYLAGDYGATIEVTRVFATGIRIGAYATFTNVPFSKYGEGSFDKGIMVHIPLEWLMPFHTTASYDMNLRSIIRDGGQRVYGDDSLYDETLGDSYGETMGSINDIVAP